MTSESGWWDVQDAVKAKGGHLATIHSDEELAACAKAAEEKGLVFVWLNACRGDWETNTWFNEEAFDYAPWYPGEPSGGNEEYLAMIRVDGQWYFNDVPENVEQYAGKKGYIIEYD